MSLPRWSVFALSVAGLAACGDDGGSNPPIDAPRAIDGRLIDAANPDAADIDATVPDAAIPDAATPDAATPDAATPDAASPDAAAPPDAASPDAPPAPMNTTVWVFGDVATDNDNQIGRFAHPQSAVVAPTFVPAAGVLTDGGGFPVSISADNLMIAYASSAAGTSPLTLSVSNTDGTGAVNVFTTTSPAVITHIAISPDKTKIAFRADMAVAGQFDIYVVPAMAAQTPVKVSPDRNNAALDALEHMTWSSDSRYLAFGGEMMTDGYNEVLVRDTMTDTTTAVVSTAAILATAAPRGMLLPAQWGPGGKLYFAAVLSAQNERKLFWSNADGTALQILPNTELTRTDTTISQTNTFSLSPDGTRIAFASDGLLATAYEVYVMPATGATAPTRLTSGTIAAASQPRRIPHFCAGTRPEPRSRSAPTIRRDRRQVPALRRCR
jgi:hypothetical protein